MGKIHLHSESSPHIYASKCSHQAKSFVLIDYNYIGKAVTKI